MLKKRKYKKKEKNKRNTQNTPAHHIYTAAIIYANVTWSRGKNKI
jgi:hypothetical protein